MNRNKLFTIFIITASFVLYSCKFFSMEYLEVTSYSPKTSYLDVSQIDSVSISFSSDASTTLTESAFSLTENGIKVPGRFEWTGKKTLNFKPYKSFQETSQYQMTLTTAAEDVNGNSLKNDFTWDFRGSPDNTRPTIVTVTPENNAKKETVQPEILFVFSEPMNPTTVFDGISFQPQLNGYFIESTDNTSFTFKLTKNLDWQTWYTITIHESLTDKAGNTLGTSQKNSFFTGVDSAELSLVSINASKPQNKPLILDNPNTQLEEITDKIDKDSKIILLFSKPIDQENVLTSIKIIPALQVNPTWNTQGNELSLSFSDNFTYNTVYSLTILSNLSDYQGNTLQNDMVFKFRSNGTASTPPSVQSVNFTNRFDSSGPVAVTPLQPLLMITLDQNTDDEAQKGFVDYYISIAEGSTISPFSFLSAFSVIAENASVTPIACQIGSDITYCQDNLPPNNITDTVVIRVILEIDNSKSGYTDNPGKIVFSLDNSFTDNQYNQLQEASIYEIYTTN